MEDASVPVGSEGESLIPRARQLVMIVDDHAAVAEMYGLGLTDGGFKAVALANASALFEALDTQVPRLCAYPFLQAKPCQSRSSRRA